MFQPLGGSVPLSPPGVPSTRLSPGCCCPVGERARSPHSPSPSKPLRGSRYRLIRHVFPTDRSPTTMILEILNLQRGGRAAQQSGEHPRADPGGITPRSPRVRSAPHPGPAHPGPSRAALPPCPPRAAFQRRDAGLGTGQRRQPRGAHAGDPHPRMAAPRAPRHPTVPTTRSPELAGLTPQCPCAPPGRRWPLWGGRRGGCAGRPPSENTAGGTKRDSGVTTGLGEVTPGLAGPRCSPRAGRR